jgi:hypothetical protein
MSSAPRPQGTPGGPRPGRPPACADTLSQRRASRATLCPRTASLTASVRRTHHCRGEAAAGKGVR